VRYPLPEATPELHVRAPCCGARTFLSALPCLLASSLSHDRLLLRGAHLLVRLLVQHIFDDGGSLVPPIITAINEAVRARERGKEGVVG